MTYKQPYKQAARDIAENCIRVLEPIIGFGEDVGEHIEMVIRMTASLVLSGKVEEMESVVRCAEAFRRTGKERKEELQ